MSTSQIILDKAIASNVSYGDLNLEMNLNPNLYMEELTRTDSDGEIKMTIEQAKAFAGIKESKDENGDIVYEFITQNKLDSNGNPIKNPDTGEYEQERISGYSIVSTSEEYDIGNLSGFDAVLLKNNETEELTFSIRGTELTSPMDFIADYQLGKDGTAYFQEISMNNFYDKLIEEGVITSSDKLTITGHSLGGFLAQKFTIDHPDVVNHTYTYNAPGIGGLASELLQLLGILPESIPNDKITNVATSGWFSIFEDAGINVGSVDVEIPGKLHLISDVINSLNDLIENGLTTISSIDQYMKFLESDFGKYDPNKQGMADPLVLDTNKDGFISTVSLEDSNAYFNIAGDETKEKVGWIKPEDAILVYDKNENGQIDGFNEVFGNENLSGFTELRQTADSNYDGKIDRQDDLYYRLQTWHDENGDGNVDIDYRKVA